MDLSRGICIFCLNNTKIIMPPQAKTITSVVKDILIGHIDSERFKNINDSLKVCPVCLFDIYSVSKLKQNIKQTFFEESSHCLLCFGQENLVYITEWSDFDKILQNVHIRRRPSKCFSCLNCLKCLKLIERIKINLFRKYPFLELTNFKGKIKTEPEDFSSPKKTYKCSGQKDDCNTVKKSTSTIKCIDNLTEALKHLKPLEYTCFNIDDFKEDMKLSKQIAFVKLKASNILQNVSGTPKISSKIKRSLNSSEIESFDHSPTQKHPFFRIKLKLNQNKTKSSKVLSGKVKKNKSHENLPSCNKKKLIVKITKMDLENINQKIEKSIENKTATKASEKILPENTVPHSNKKRKSVTFAEVLDSDITEGTSRKDNKDSSPLKSLLKKTISPTSELSNSDLDYSLNLILDSDEEMESSKSCKDIISDDMEVSNSTEVSSQNFNKCQEIATSTSEINHMSNEEQTENRNNSKTEKRKITDVNDGGYQNEDCRESTELKGVKKIKKSDNDIDSNSQNGDESILEGEYDILQDQKNDKIECQSNPSMSLEDQKNEISSTVNNGADPYLDNQISTPDTRSQDEEISNQDSQKFLDRKNMFYCDKSNEPNIENIMADDNSSISENIMNIKVKGTEKKDMMNVYITKTNMNSYISNVDKTNYNKEDQNSEYDSDSRETNKSGNDSSCMETKKKVTYRNIREHQNKDDIIEKNKTEQFEEAETKKEKSSELEMTSICDVDQEIAEDTILENRSEAQTVGTVDNKIDELIAKYTNPIVPKLNIDNVSDNQNAEVGGKNRRSGSEVYSLTLEEALSKVKNVEKEILEQSTENDVTCLPGNNSGIYIFNNDVTPKDDVKEFDLDNILNDIVDDSSGMVGTDSNLINISENEK